MGTYYDVIWTTSACNQGNRATDSKSRGVDLEGFDTSILGSAGTVPEENIPPEGNMPMEPEGNTPLEQPQELPALRRSGRIHQQPIRYEPHFHLTQPNSWGRRSVVNNSVEWSKWVGRIGLVQLCTMLSCWSYVTLHNRLVCPSCVSCFAW